MLTREILAKVRKIDIRSRRIVDQLSGGAYRSLFKGRGMEFSDVREYVEGDDVRSIDWNVTARSMTTHIKQYTEERELTVFLAVDISASGDFGGGQSKLAMATEIAAVLALSAIRNRDRVGLMLHSNAEELHLPPRRGRSHALRLIRELVAHERRETGTDLGALMERLGRSLHRRAIIFIISDLLDEGFERQMAIVGARHELIVLQVHSPLERDFPATPALLVHDLESGALARWKPSTLDLQQRLEDGRRRAIRAGADVLSLPVDRDFTATLMAFFRRGGRK